MSKKEKITDEELKTLQQANAELTNLKLAYGDLELNKLALNEKTKSLKTLFASIEKDLVANYGKDAIINAQTGQIKRKQDA